MCVCVLCVCVQYVDQLSWAGVVGDQNLLTKYTAAKLRFGELVRY